MPQQIIGDIVHSVGARYRVRGSGTLRTRMWNLDQERVQDLENINMSTPSSREKTIIANFQDQGIQIQFRTISIDEVFTINKIVCFVKPVAESYPIRSGG
jgi:hypothetical protein